MPLHLGDAGLQRDAAAAGFEGVLLQSAEVIERAAFGVFRSHGCSLVDAKQEVEPQAPNLNFFRFEIVQRSHPLLHHTM
jgi:hypothetical protein